MLLKTFNLIILLFLLSACGSEQDSAMGHAGDNDHDFWVSLETAERQALDEGKYIVLDIYTEWCGYCRRMNRETYADQRVNEALDRFFYPVRIDAESSENVTFQGSTYEMRDLAVEFGVRSYPTTVFISPDGEVIAAQTGFIEPETFHRMLSFVGSESYKDKTFREYTDSAE